MRGTFLGGPHNKDYRILGSILGSPYVGKLPYVKMFVPFLEAASTLGAGIIAGNPKKDLGFDNPRYKPQASSRGNDTVDGGNLAPP